MRHNYPNINKHPIETGRYIISTNQINNSKAIIYNWINMRLPGAIIYGKPRVGKTSLINYIRHTIEADFGFLIPSYHIKWTTHLSSKENTFFENMLSEVNHGIPFEGRPSEKRKRLSNFLINVVEESDQNKLIFFIDDAQRLKNNDFEWLMDIYNELDSFGISLITILVAQEEIIHTLNSFKRHKQLQIIGRFMADDYRYTGFIKKEDFEVLLKEYDTYTEFPPESNITFTQHYFSQQYDEGFRLMNSIDYFLTAFATIQDDHNILEFREIPALYVIRTVEYILKNYGTYGENLSELNVQHWLDGIENSGYIVANTNLYKDKKIDEFYLNDNF